MSDAQIDSIRNNVLDTAAGILIVRIILGHYLSMAGLGEAGVTKALYVIYFFMLWFFFKSGMFRQQKSAIEPYRGGVKY